MFPASILYYKAVLALLRPPPFLGVHVPCRASNIFAARNCAGTPVLWDKCSALPPGIRKWSQPAYFRRLGAVTSPMPLVRLPMLPLHTGQSVYTSGILTNIAFAVGFVGVPHVQTLHADFCPTLRQTCRLSLMVCPTIFQMLGASVRRRCSDVHAAAAKP